MENLVREKPLLTESAFYKEIHDTDLGRSIIAAMKPNNTVREFIAPILNKENLSDHRAPTRISIFGFNPDAQEERIIATSTIMDNERLNREMGFDEVLEIHSRSYPGKDRDALIMTLLMALAAGQLDLPTTRARDAGEYMALLLNEYALASLISVIFNDPLDVAIGIIVDPDVPGHFYLQSCWVHKERPSSVVQLARSSSSTGT